MPKAALASVLAAALSTGEALAQGWPSQPLGFATIVQPSPAAPDGPTCPWYDCAPHRGYLILREGPRATAPTLPSLDDARALLEAGQFSAARDRLEDLAVRTPQDPGIWALLGRAERGLGHLGAAGESLRRALVLDAGHPGALAEQGFLLLAEGRPAEALATMEALTRSCAECREAIKLRSALTGAGYHAGGAGPKRIRVQP